MTSPTTLSNLCWAHLYKVLLFAILLLMGVQFTFTILSKQQTEPVVLPGILPPWHGEPRQAFQHASIKVTPLALEMSSGSMIYSSMGNTTDNATTASSPNATQQSNLPLCPLVPPHLVGRLTVMKEAPSMEELEKMHPDLELGGRFRPKECTSRSRVAIIIPYRDRAEHLRIFLHNIHPMLKRQQLDYGIFIVEQAGTKAFNRAMMMNIGFVEALKQYDYQCFIFHDVDLIPEDDRNIYSCPYDQPRHMSVAVDKFRYRLPYTEIFGGVSALTKAQFLKVNGFSNMYWGWGGEDDDMASRLSSNGYKITRYKANIARYSMLSHRAGKANPRRYEYLASAKKRFSVDGLSNLKYEKLDLLLKRLYTWVFVKVSKTS